MLWAQLREIFDSGQPERKAHALKPNTNCLVRGGMGGLLRAYNAPMVPDCRLILNYSLLYILVTY